jgi:thiol-disulfide isomerase/thioredoxin
MRGFLAMMLGALVLSATVPVTAGLMLAPGDRAPSLDAPSLDGGRVALNWGLHRLTLVNLWATWCLPCRDEMPALDALHRKWSDAGLRVVGVAVDGSREKAMRTLVEQLDVSYTILLGDRRLAARWGGGNILPTSYLVDAEGKIVLRVVGGTTEDLDLLTRRVESLLGQDATAEDDDAAP